MLEFLASFEENEAIAILKEDHEKVKKLFDKFEKSTDFHEKKSLVAKVINELKIHTEIEEKIFYPAVRCHLDESIMNEADEEHHVAKLLITELEQMHGTEEHYDAKFKVLAENVRHHIKEEESEMLPQAHKLEMDFDVLGHDMQAMKLQLKEKGMPLSLEEELMQCQKNDDSPAQTARVEIY